MATDGWTAHDHVSQSAEEGPSHADMEGLARTLLDFCAQAAVLFATQLLF
jgi:hypothetical protein